MKYDAMKQKNLTQNKFNEAERERERFIPSHNNVKTCSQNHSAL